MVYFFLNKGTGREKERLEKEGSLTSMVFSLRSSQCSLSWLLNPIPVSFGNLLIGFFSQAPERTRIDQQGPEGATLKVWAVTTPQRIKIIREIQLETFGLAPPASHGLKWDSFPFHRSGLTRVTLLNNSQATTPFSHSRQSLQMKLANGWLVYKDFSFGLLLITLQLQQKEGSLGSSWE